MVTLSDVLTRSDQTIGLEATREYREITVKLWGRGVVQRGVVTGAAISGQRRYVARAGHFILSRIDARNGALGIVPPELDGAVISNDFPVFQVNEERMSARYLGWMCRTRAFVEECKRASEGTTNRVRLQERSFLAREVALPPISEQRRVVQRIEELAGELQDAHAIRQNASTETALLVPSGLSAIFQRLGKQHSSKRLDELCEVVRGGSPRPAGSPTYYGGAIPFIKVGDLTKDDCKYLHEASASVNELGRQQSRYIEADTLMLTNSGATLGVPKITKIAGCFNDGSQAFLNISPLVDQEYLYYLFKSKTLWFREQLARGQGQPNLNTEMTKTMEVPLPPRHEQQKAVAAFNDLQVEVETLKRAQAETVAQLDSLLPAILDSAFKGELV